MFDDLLPYYRRELAALRDDAGEFAQRYPRVASRLLLTGETSSDPSVERLLEGVAFLAARVHRRLDDSFADITETLLEILAPQLVRPMPARLMVQARYDPARLPRTFPATVPRGTMLRSGVVRSNQTIDAIPCTFRTTAAVDVWPVEVTEARMLPLERSRVVGTAAQGTHVLSLRLACPEQVAFAGLGMDRLALTFQGADAVFDLYDAVTSRLNQVLVGPTGEGKYWPLPAEAVRPLGFEAEDALFDYDRRTHEGFRLLQDYFLFPEKFLGVAVEGLRSCLTGIGSETELHFVFGEAGTSTLCESLINQVDASMVQPNTVPAVNLFPMRSEPIPLRPGAIEYPVVADVRRPRAFEVYSVEGAQLLARGQRIRHTPLSPLFGRLRAYEDQPAGSWVLRRDVGADGGLDTRIQIAGTGPDAPPPEEGMVVLDLLCTNRDLPQRMALTQTYGELSAVSGGSVQWRARGTVHRPLRPPLGTDTLWRLLSQLSVNQMSLVEMDGTPLRDLLRLFAGIDGRQETKRAMETAKQIAGLKRIDSQPAVERIGTGSRQAFVRGLDIDVTLDPEAFVGASALLFGAVLERFLAEYATVNSFTRTTIHIQDAATPPVRWPARTGGKSTL